MFVEDVVLHGRLTLEFVVADSAYPTGLRFQMLVLADWGTAMMEVLKHVVLLLCAIAAEVAFKDLELLRSMHLLDHCFDPVGEARLVHLKAVISSTDG